MSCKQSPSLYSKLKHIYTRQNRIKQRTHCSSKQIAQLYREYCDVYSKGKRRRGKSKYLVSLGRCLGFEHLVQSPETKYGPLCTFLNNVCKVKRNKCKHKAQVSSLTPAGVVRPWIPTRAIFVAGMKTDITLPVSVQRIINPVDACCQG